MEFPVLILAVIAATPLTAPSPSRERVLVHSRGVQHAMIIPQSEHGEAER